MTDLGCFAVLQALEGKDVKDLLSNVGSGGGAAPAAAGGAAAAAGGAAEAAPEEAKEEGQYSHPGLPARYALEYGANNLLQRRRSPTMTWASVSSTKRLISARRVFDSSGSLCTSKACLDLLRRRIAFTTIGMGALISRVLVHRRSLHGKLRCV